MLRAFSRSCRTPSPLPCLVAPCLAAAVLALASPGRADAQAPRDALFITVPSDLNDSAVGQIEAKVTDAVERQKRKLAVVVFDFTPGGKPAGSTRLGACIELKNYLERLRLGQAHAPHPPVHTVAFVHGELTKHSVLPALACAELVMSPQGKIGDVLRDAPGRRLTQEGQTAYEAVAKRLASPDLVRRLIEPNLVLAKVKTRDAVLYVDKAKLDAGKGPPGPLAEEKELPKGLEAGNTVLTGEQARACGLCTGLYEARADVAEAFNLARHSLREDWLAGRTAVPYLIEVNGTIDAGRLESLKRNVSAAVRGGANLIILQLNCEGGETVDVASHARWLRELTDPSGTFPVKTIAYVPPGRSLGAATFLALGCTEIAMAPDAALGDFNYLKGEGEDSLRPKRDMLVKLAKEQEYPALLFQATLDPSLVLYQVRTPGDRGGFRLVRQADLKGDETEKVRLVAPPGETFKVNADLARFWGVARHADIDSAQKLYQRYQLDPDRVRVVRDDWLDRVAEFFREPLVNVFLIMIGIAALILEMKMPGIGLPGVVAGICFVLFFWAHSFVGQFTMLAVLLFILGLVLIGLEVFVMPGFGVAGVSGVVLLVASLVLVTLERMPETTQDWLTLGGTLTTFAVSLVMAVGLGFTLSWYLPHIPYANRLILAPPTEEEDGTATEPLPGTTQPAAALLGAIGEAATPLRPAGKARFGDDFLDVVSEGDYINPGARVQVVEIEGNRIVVKEV